MPKVISQDLHSIPVPSQVMKQIGIDICNLPEVGGFKHLVVCIDYFSKWSEAKPLRDKSAPTVAQFLYELISRHVCVSIQINDQGREFVNAVSEKLLRMTGAEQRMTSAYHPQANGLCERQNRSIKDSLVKVLYENPTEWPYIIEGILFAHRVSRHYSWKAKSQLLSRKEKNHSTPRHSQPSFPQQTSLGMEYTRMQGNIFRRLKKSKKGTTIDVIPYLAQ